MPRILKIVDQSRDFLGSQVDSPLTPSNSWHSSLSITGDFEESQCIGDRPITSIGKETDEAVELNQVSYKLWYKNCFYKMNF